MLSANSAAVTPRRRAKDEDVGIELGLKADLRVIQVAERLQQVGNLVVVRSPRFAPTRRFLNPPPGNPDGTS